MEFVIFLSLVVGIALIATQLSVARQKIIEITKRLDLEKKAQAETEQKLKSANLDLQKYSPIIELDHEIEKRRSKADFLKQAQSDLEFTIKTLTEEVRLLTEDHDLLSAGFYKPKYDFAEAKHYKEKLEDIRDKQKALIKDKQAIVCSTSWEVGGSKAEGKKMTDRTIRLGLAAFNVQCDNEIFSVRFDNIDRCEAKIEKIRDNVNKLLEPNMCSIMDPFYKLKIEELYLAYEYAEKVQKEKEEQRALKEQAKDEDKARREAERAQAEAEKEELRYEAALEKARQELEKKSDGEREAYEAKVRELEAQLQEAHENRERAKSLAEQTKRGHVYIISNIGSFGEDVYKIGMTRRLDPMDRVWELSDASVPFDFDVHAIVKSEDAPALERTLHEQFTKKRVNAVNPRKEFFRAKIEEIAEACKRCHGDDFQLTLVAEAKEYRQSKAQEKDKNEAA